MSQIDDQPFAEIVAEIRDFIRDRIGARVGVVLSKSDDEQTFKALGLDSASQAELEVEASQRFGVRLADFAAREHGSPAAFARHVAHVLTGDLASAAEPETLRTGSAPPAARPSQPELQGPLALAFSRSVELE